MGMSFYNQFMRYFNKTFFKFLFVFGLIVVGGLFFLSKVSAQSSLVNINTASLEELDTLPGIGPVIAQRILDYRTLNGPFSQIEEIKEVSGIGDSVFEDIRGLITVGTVNVVEQNGAQNTNSNQQETSPSTSASGLVVQEGVDYKIILDKEKIGSVGSPIDFRAKHNIKDKRIAIAWTFGDGSMAYGQNVSHVYEYPGEYVVVASANLLGDKISARMSVNIVPNTLSITHASPQRIEITNTGKNEISLNVKELNANGRSFVFPEETIIKGGQKISFSNKVTGLSPANTSGVVITSVGSSSLVLENAPKSVAVQDKTREEELIQKILTLQRKQMELKNKEEEVKQVAAVVLSEEPELEAKDEGVGWFKTIKKFFGFK